MGRPSRGETTGVSLRRGYWHLKYEPVTPLDRIVVDDLGVTLLMNSQVSWRNATSLIEHAGDVDLGALPQNPLQETTEEERQRIAELIGKLLLSRTSPLVLQRSSRLKRYLLV